MVVQSKLKLWTTASCYELGHTWSPHCTQASLDLAKASYSYSLRLYAIFYIVSSLVKVKGRINKIKWRKYVRDVVQSSLFLGSNALLFLSSFCTFRRMFGGFNITFGFLCGLPSCFIAISIERKERRGVLALYVANLAAEILFNMAVCRGYIKPIKYGELNEVNIEGTKEEAAGKIGIYKVLIFSITTALAMYLLRVGDILQSDAQSTLKSLFGSCELPSHLQEPSLTGEVATQDSNTIFSRIYQFLPKEAQRILTVLTRRVKDLPRHRLCKHQFSCIYNFSEGFLSRFCLGYAIQTAFNLFRSIPKALRKPSSIAWSLIDKNNFYLGLFMGGLAGLFRIIMCLLRWIRDKDSPFHALLAGFLSGLSSFAYRSNAIALYFASRIAENLFFFGQRKGFIPSIPAGDRILYTLSTSTILHASVFEPHTIRPAYWQFLLRLTGNYFALMNRKIIDVLGTHASKLYPNFWPKYDLRHVSPQLQTEELYNWWFTNIFQKM